MQKLIIHDIAKMNDDWYAVCFHGPERSHHAMNVFLARQPKEYAYWDENGLHGKGAWIVRLDFFKRLTARFGVTVSIWGKYTLSKFVLS